MTPLRPRDITGLVLAGGQGTRMGGVDKGLQVFRGQPLALRALERLRPQVGALMISANRHLANYAAFGVPVWPDARVDDIGYPGPLAGFLSGLAHCRTPWLLTVPCDTPHFPLDLAKRLGRAALAQGADIAVACAPDASSTAASPSAFAGPLRPQPVFCLLRTDLHDSLRDYLAAGGRKVGAWTAQHRAVRVPFDLPGDAPGAFANANTLAELEALQAWPVDALAGSTASPRS